MRAYCGVQVQLHKFLTAPLDGGEWSASSPGVWVGPKAGLNPMGKAKFLYPCWESKPGWLPNR